MTGKNYTCNDYRQEMILIGLRTRLESEELSEKEKLEILREINELQKQMDM